MNEIANISAEQTMSSLQIAELTGKLHKDVMKAIRTMEEAWVKVNGRKFALVDYTDAKGEKRPCYQLTKTECLYIATKFNDEARAKLILRWEELERVEAATNPRVPRSFREALLLAAAQQEQIEEQQRLIAEKDATIKGNAPKVAFANALISSNSSCLIGELAKILTQNGYEIGQNRLFEWLRQNDYLGKHGERRNIPNQQYIEQGLFELKKGVRSGNDGVMHTTVTPKVTTKGQQYFIYKFLAR